MERGQSDRSGAVNSPVHFTTALTTIMEGPRLQVLLAFGQHRE